MIKLTDEIKESYKNITSLVEGYYSTTPICYSIPITSVKLRRGNKTNNKQSEINQYK